ncbi:MAG: SdiA-regulated domain-containing protein [Bacteroidota bacterium]
MKRISTIIILFVFLAACQKEKVDVPIVEVPEGSLKLISSYQLDILEPSGISFGPDGQTLLIVSDNANMVYETNLEGEIIRTLNYVGADLEGVVYNPDENIVALAEERLREIVLLDYEVGNEIGRYPINVENNNDNKGLEGLSYNLNNKAYYIVNEDLPGELIVWNPKFGIIEKKELHFAIDYSAIFVDDLNSILWILSDDSQTMYKCDYKANVLMEFILPRTKYEGLIVDVDLMKAYYVNDATAKLEVFDIEISISKGS